MVVHDRRKMKKVLFLVYSMNVGGVEKSLLSLLSVLPLDQLEIHIGLINKSGGFMDFIPPEVRVHEINCYQHFWHEINEPPIWSIKQAFLKGRVKDSIVLMLLWLDFKITHSRIRFFQYLLKDEPIFPEAYDLAISFAGPSEMLDYYVCEKVNARRKCGWIHFDVSMIGVDKGMIKKLYKYYEKVFLVSEEARKVFISLFPQLSHKTEVFNNIVSCEQIRSLASIGHSYNDGFDGKRILTVGRLSKEKGQRVAILALKLLISLGYNVKWYFVGEGKDLHNCEELAKDLGVDEFVVFLGMQTNPYGFMRDCDVYVQPSRYEGSCITLAEASCFKIPIVATNFTGANERLHDRSNGFVTGMSANEIVNGVIKAIEIGPLQQVIPLINCDDLTKLLSLLS